VYERGERLFCGCDDETAASATFLRNSLAFDLFSTSWVVDDAADADGFES